MKVWITGAGGMMGSHLAEMLLAAGHDVYATYCRPTIDPSDLQIQRSRSRYHRLVLGLRFDSDIPPRRGISSRGPKLSGGFVGPAG